MNFNALKQLPPWEWPRDAGETLLRVARDKNSREADRLLALELAGDCTVMDDFMALALLNFLQDPEGSEKLRAKAAVALGPVLEYVEILDFATDEMTVSKPVIDQIQQTLRRLHENGEVPKPVRRRCLEASVRSPQPWHADAIRKTYLSKEEEDQLTSIFCMGYIEGFQEELDQAMEDENPSIRNEALKALANWQEDDPWFDLDDPVSPDTEGEPGLDDLLLLSGMKVPGLSGKGNLWKQPLNGYDGNPDRILDELFRTLTDEGVPWDDEFMGDDPEDEDGGR